MTDSPVIFRILPSGREIAMLGNVEVGEVGACDFGGMFYWRLWLPGCTGFGRAGAPKIARDYLATKIKDWVDAAGLSSSEPAPEIRAFRPDDWGTIKRAVRT